MNVAYGVANNSLKLPIPKTCPEGWAKLMTSMFIQFIARTNCYKMISNDMNSALNNR